MCNPCGGRGSSRYINRKVPTLEISFDIVLEKYLEKDISVCKNQGSMQSKIDMGGHCFSLAGEPLG